MNHRLFALTSLSLASLSLALPAAPALASHHHGPRYDRQGRYAEPQRLSNGDRVWRGDDGRYHCRRANGTTGLIIGGAAGALLGRTVDTRGDRTMGTVIGAAGGALLGREIERSNLRCR